MKNSYNVCKSVANMTFMLLITLSYLIWCPKYECEYIVYCIKTGLIVRVTPNSGVFTIISNSLKLAFKYLFITIATHSCVRVDS